MSCPEGSTRSGVHCVAASYLSSEQLTCTLFFSPSQKICTEGKTRTALSRRLTRLLRHEAVRRGLAVGSDGYISISNILNLPEYHQFSVSDVLYIVSCDAKRRYSVRLDKVVDLHTRRGRCTNFIAAVNKYKSSSSYGGNPLLAEEHIPVAQDKLSAAVPVIADAACRDNFSQVIRDNVLPMGPRSAAASVVGTAGKQRERSRDNTSHAEVTSCVVCWRGECASRLERRLACPAPSIGITSVSRDSACCKANSGNRYAACGAEKCDDYHTSAGSAIRERSFNAERYVRFCVDSGGNLVSGSVDASLISVRAVQGHSISGVDSDILLRRVFSWADLVGKISLSLHQKDAATKPFSGGHGSSWPTNPRPSTRSAKAGICVVHGTYWRCWQRIQKTGLSRMSRNHIHFASCLPEDGESISGIRPNSEILIFLDVQRTLAAGLHLYVSGNGVILSPGNEEGIIDCKFFERAVDRKTGRRLLISGEEDHGAANTQNAGNTVVGG